MKIAIYVALIGACALLAGCASTGPGSVAGGECRIFEQPPYVVKGKRTYDQDWIDSQIEGGVGGCNWQRPKERPASIDGGQPAKPGKAAPTQKRRGVLRRVKERVFPTATVAPVVSAPVLEQPPPSPPPPPPPRDPVDELLDPIDAVSPIIRRVR